MTGIEWTNETWNPTTGCDRVSVGCDNCYALTMAKRLKAMGDPKYQRDGDPRTSGPGFGLSVHPDTLDAPLRWRKPRRVFVNSMSDLFHDRVPDEFIARVFAVMAATPQHTYQVLTKRHGRMRSLLCRVLHFKELVVQSYAYLPQQLMASDMAPLLDWPLPNVWLGVSVEDQKRADLRIPALLDTPAAVRFLSCEPLLGPVDLSRWMGALVCGCGVPPESAPGWSGGCCAECMQPERSDIDWVIVGGESGSSARPMHPDWARALVKQCQRADVSVFVKQLGSMWARGASGATDSKGGSPDEWSADLRVREFPVVSS